MQTESAELAASMHHFAFRDPCENEGTTDVEREESKARELREERGA